MPQSRLRSAPITPKIWSASGASEGFTIAEMIIVVAVMAVLISISVAPISQYIDQRNVQQERNSQIELQKALASYAEQNRSIPTDVITTSVTDPNNWYNALARYTNMSPGQIRFDTWGNERRYIMAIRQESLLGNTVPVFYATVVSAGLNGAAQTGTGIVAGGGGGFTYNAAAGGSIGGFADAANGGWWSRQGDFVSAFSAAAATGDDLLARFTDYAAKIEKYNQTLERLNKVAEALENYSKAKYAEDVVSDNTAPGSVADGNGAAASPDNLIYYPFAASSQSLAQAADGWANYSRRTALELAAIKNTANTYAGYVDNGSDDRTRYFYMVDLMRLLGLPDSNCCSALDSFMDGTTRREMPFYYASNPRPRNSGGGCGARPNPRANPPQTTLPARISVRSITDSGTCY